MIYILKNQSISCKNAILAFRHDCKKQGIAPHYDHFREKELLRLSLLEEQGYICAYCMQRVLDNPLKTKIEHWKTREDYNLEKDSEGTLDYDNLFAVCDGKTLDTLHCDSKRAEKNPKLTVKPTDKQLTDQIIYLKNGKMQCFNDDIAKDLNEHLNLNIPFLSDNRKKVLDDVQKIFAIKCKNKSFQQSELIKSKIIQHFMSKKSGYFEVYCGIVAYFYKKYL